ncbi:SusC/RagA family TonB-linked outer membrane protein [Sphingobacterium mizutaii]|uniref:SusC/RagA family TonB-linked outer membrane protein n=1 Tax=Sphingobacterium mizutaii TaxID=1010 RepID=UPI0016263B61|nr:TonB-dependent receptor [Sphingobacterium mizutaii]
MYNLLCPFLRIRNRSFIINEIILKNFAILLALFSFLQANAENIDRSDIKGKANKKANYFFNNSEFINETPIKWLEDHTVNKEVDNVSSITENDSFSPKVIEEKIQLQVTGKVTDEEGNALSGVTVRIKDEDIAIRTGEDGGFNIQVNTGTATLVFSYIGYATQEIPVDNRQVINVQLLTQQAGLNEIVVVGYGTQRKGNITGSIATVSSEDLVSAPLTTPANALAGRLPGLISLQSSGRPGADAAHLSIRGFGQALVIVDGIETDFRFIDPNQIESISILKDASASIYGSRAGNGVILVTTKRGVNSKPTFTINSSQTFQGITVMPRPVNAGQYAELTREAYLNSGKPESTAPFTEEQIQKYYDGTDPLFPNTNWYKELIKEWAPLTQHNISIRGGSDAIKYYGFLGYLDQKTAFKLNGGKYNRYNFQSNIDAKIQENFNLQLTVSGISEIRNFPQMSMDVGEVSAWGFFWNTLPIYPARLPDPTKVPFADGNGTGGAHVVSNREISGYNNSDALNLRSAISLNYGFKNVPGLMAKAFGNYARDFAANRIFIKPVTLYSYDPTSEVYSVAGAYGSQASLSVRDDKSTVLTGQLSLNYDRVFAEDHHVTALALYEVIDSKWDFVSASRTNFLTDAIDQLYAGSNVGVANNGSASEMGRVSYVGRLNYSYANKYLLESILRADASAKFPSNSRWGYFPSVSLGWIINRESFMDKYEYIDNLKLRVSYGQSGNDAIGNFQYLSGYQIGALPYILGPGSQSALESRGLANPYLTWEKIKTSNLGVDFSFFQSLLYGEADIFYRLRSGILANRIATVPSSFGSILPPENLNSQSDRGFELRVGTRGKNEKWVWDISGNISWSRAKWEHFEEPEYTDPLQIRLNKLSNEWVDREIGFLSDGLFTSQEQIDNLTYEYPNGNDMLRPGDLIIKDNNNDGIIDTRDQVIIGKGVIPHWMLGLNTNLKYKDFDLSMLFQGALDYYSNIVFTQGKTFSSFVYDNRWTEENNDANALIPRLGGAPTNTYYTNRNYKRADYIRLKSITIGYNLPAAFLDKISIKQARFYLAATNIFTLGKLDKYDIDPESPSNLAGWYYPQQKTISLGANISF